ncbi:tetratricopeptide repeat protein [Nocardia sp. NPDC050408]|uniref:tetratricopeptide repeat protein n=1 Tax=Nocardia sp. NPDC050408 TaxID=3364319 RepID=UPI0037B8AF2F
MTRTVIGDMVKGRYITAERLRLAVQVCGVPDVQIGRWLNALTRLNSIPTTGPRSFAIADPSAAIKGQGLRLPSLVPVVAGLPRDVPDLVGRGDELSTLLEQTGAGQVMSIYTVDGMAGVGKTALVIHAAYRLTERFPDGQFFVDLHAHTPGKSVADPADVLADLLTDVGVDPQQLPDTLSSRRALWRDHTATRRILLVLDDAFDHTQVEPLLPSGWGCLTLITSRTRLIALDAAVPLAVDTLDPAGAAELFWMLSRREPGAGEDAAVEQIVRLCGYLPLAIVLLAGRLAHHPRWSISSLATEFAATQNRLSELTAGPRAVRAAFDMSYRNLPVDRQRLFRRLGLHPGHDIDAYAVSALDNTTLDSARRELDSLYTDNLIEETSLGRYRMHDLLREYARTLARVDAADHSSRAIDRLLAYFQFTAHTADQHLARSSHRPPLSLKTPPAQAPSFPDSTAALTWLQSERPNLLACIDFAATTDRHTQTVGLTFAISSFLRSQMPRPYAVSLHQQAASIAHRTSDHIGEASSLLALADLRQLLGDFSSNAELSQRALTIFRGIGHRLGEADALRSLGWAKWRLGDLSGAADLHQQALEIFRQIGNRLGEANALDDLGRVQGQTGNSRIANQLHTQALKIYRDLGNQVGYAGALHGLGRTSHRLGEYPTAIELHTQALQMYRALRERLGEASALHDLARTHHQIGDYATAAELHTQALNIDRDLAHHHGEANALHGLACTHHQIGNHTTATELHTQALNIYRRIGNRAGEAQALTGIARARGSENDRSAIEMFDQALTIYRQIGSREGETETLNDLGKLMTQLQEPQKGQHFHEQGLRLAHETQNPLEEARAHEGIARALALLGETTHATTEMQAAVSVYVRIGAAETHQATTYLALLHTNPHEGTVETSTGT